MAVHTYDCTLILDSNKYVRDAAGAAAQIKQAIEAHGGDLLVSRIWEERRLAYPIAGHRKGTYWICFFKGDPLKVTKIEREFQLSELVLRTLILKVEPRIADALVAQASGERPVESRVAKTEPAAEEVPAE